MADLIIFVYFISIYNRADAGAGTELFVPALKECVSSAIHMTRVMAARALVPLIPTGKVCVKFFRPPVYVPFFSFSIFFSFSPFLFTRERCAFSGGPVRYLFFFFFFDTHREGVCVCGWLCLLAFKFSRPSSSVPLFLFRPVW